jgi:hypothetical protein
MMLFVKQFSGFILMITGFMYLPVERFPGTTLLDRDPEVAEAFDGRLPDIFSMSGYDNLYWDHQCAAGHLMSGSPNSDERFPSFWSVCSRQYGC